MAESPSRVGGNLELHSPHWSCNGGNGLRPELIIRSVLCITICLMLYVSHWALDHLPLLTWKASYVRQTSSHVGVRVKSNPWSKGEWHCTDIFGKSNYRMPRANYCLENCEVMNTPLWFHPKVLLLFAPSLWIQLGTPQFFPHPSKWHMLRVMPLFMCVIHLSPVLLAMPTFAVKQMAIGQSLTEPAQVSDFPLILIHSVISHLFWIPTDTIGIEAGSIGGICVAAFNIFSALFCIIYSSCIVKKEDEEIGPGEC